MISKLERIFLDTNIFIIGDYVPSTIDWNEEKLRLINEQIIPSEDIEIYLSAKYGKANCFVSGNRELIKAIADFECLTADDFVKKYIES